MPQSVESIHANSKIVEVVVAKLRVDTSYQRDFSETLVDEIANEWDAIAAELITVSDRGPRTNDTNGVEGGLWIVNGQHRSKAAAKKGLTTIWARVIDLRKEVDPARIEAGFRLRTNKKLSDRPLERFKAQVRSYNDESLDIEKIVGSFGAEINTSISPDTGINCVSTIEKIYRIDDGAILRDTLSIINDTYGHVGGRNTKSPLLKGVCWFIEKHHEETNRDRLVQKMQGIGLESLDGRARSSGLTMGGSLWVNYYRSIVTAYNENLKEKNRLEWKLRGKNVLGGGGGAG